MVHDYVKQGKKNKASGRAFELRVRKDLESKNWTICKWSNNVDLKYNIVQVDTSTMNVEKGIVGTAVNSVPGKIIPAKHKFNPFSRVMSIGTGFPDFIIFKRTDIRKEDSSDWLYQLQGVEVKSNGTLSKEEKEKCIWYLENNIFSKILIASKSIKRGKIEYKEFTI